MLPLHEQWVNPTIRLQDCKTAPSDHKQEPEQFSSLVNGSRVMLRANFRRAKGLVNGALGTVIDIFYDPCKRRPVTCHWLC